MDGFLSPLGPIERYVSGEDSWVRVDIDEVGGRLVQVDQQMLALSSCFDKA